MTGRWVAVITFVMVATATPSLLAGAHADEAPPTQQHASCSTK